MLFESGDRKQVTFGRSLSAVSGWRRPAGRLQSGSLSPAQTLSIRSKTGLQTMLCGRVRLG